VLSLFRKNFEDEQEVGAAFALMIAGERLVDLWAGDRFPLYKGPWEADTLVPISSTTKIVVSLCGLLLVERGLLDLDSPISSYWPEFAANGKAEIPVRYIFSHSTGLAGLDDFPDMSVWTDTEEVSRRLAAQKPWWTPGESSGYHGITYGYLIGELVRRITGKTLDEFFRSEIGDHHGIDFFLDPQHSPPDRVSSPQRVEPEPNPVSKRSVYYRAMGYMMDMNTKDDGELELPRMKNGNAVTNARALTQIGTILATGSLDGKQYLGEETASLPYQEQIYKKDLLFWAPVRYGVGFGMSSNEFPLPWKNAFHWGGFGGSSMIMVPELGAAWAYTPNKFYSGRGVMDHRAEPIREELIRILT